MTTPKDKSQVCYAADKLDKNGEWLVNELAQYVTLKKGQP